ncbi:4'-phosphopantetheinyl transferase superfamily protein [Paraglaciecola sp.]|uniref:4'-phosphopantetheinyl transferase family protein n=1 Tax=Paraglaciecola sp. TaxID=1920173 RepID=UPI0032669C6E
MEEVGKFNGVEEFSTESSNLFYCDVQTCSIQNQKIFSLLNDEDCERFVRINKTLRKYQFGIARCLVKQVLCEYFDIPLEHKYTLTDYCEWLVVDISRKFYISISHSKNIVVVAISSQKSPIGVDIEFQKDRNFNELINSLGTENEKLSFQKSLDKKRMFYRLWTAKEAYIKAFQLSLSELTKIDLSELNHNEYDQEFQIQEFTLENNKYCLSLLSNKGKSATLQKVVLN